MPWFVIQRERKTWTKYLVKAESAEAAAKTSDDWKYLGHVDGDDTAETIVGCFSNPNEAVRDTAAYVEK